MEKSKDIFRIKKRQLKKLFEITVLFKEWFESCKMKILLQILHYLALMILIIVLKCF